MSSTAVGELVKVTAGGQELDGIVFDTPSANKVVVSVFEPGRGPVFRTVRPEAIAAREEEGPQDRALRLLIRRTPPPTRRHGQSGSGTVHGRDAHSRGAVHRTSDH